MSVIDRIYEDQPVFHQLDDVDTNWYALPGTLKLIDRYVQEGDATLEVGAGASTVVFASKAASHTVISPAPLEHERIIRYCHDLQLETDHVTFHAATSDQVLPSLPPDGLDFVFIDGSHSFPHAVIDWHYTQSRLRPGGFMLLDDIILPSTAVVWDAMAWDRKHWELVTTIDDRSAIFRKLADLPTRDLWGEQPFNRRRPTVRTLPIGRRAPVLASHWTVRARRLAGRSQLARRLYDRVTEPRSS